MRALSLAFLGAASCAPPTGLQARLQAVLDERAKLWNTSFSFGLTVGGDTIAAASGIDNVKTMMPIDTDTRIPMGSVTKLYTSVAAFQLAEQGKLDLDAPFAAAADPLVTADTGGRSIAELWGANASTIATVTTRQLLAMRAGVPDYDNDAMEAWTLNISNLGQDITPPDYATTWTPKSFLFAPGSGGSYSSTGFVLAGYAVAAAAGAKGWEGFDQRSILGGAPTLSAAAPNFQFGGRGPCYNIPNASSQYWGYSVQEVPYWLTEHFVDTIYQSCLNGWTAGSVVAAPQDVSKVLYAALSPHAAEPLVSAASRAAMQDFQPLTVGWSEGLMYGVGTMEVNLYSTAGVEAGYTTFVGHGGEDYASSADMHYYNAKLDAAVVLGMGSTYGMQCGLVDLSDNQYAAKDVGCRVWAAVVDELTGGAQHIACPQYVPSGGEATAAAPGGDEGRARDGGARADLSAAARALGGAKAHALLHRWAQPAPLGGASPLFSCQGAAQASTCTGPSAGLNATDCYTWKALFALANGRKWSRCAGGVGATTGSATDPCACAGVTCAAGASGEQRIIGLNMSDANLRGDMAAVALVIVSFSELQALDLSGNQLYGALPALPFGQPGFLTGGCSISGNPLSCPLPAGADTCHRADQPPPACEDPTKPSNVSATCLAAAGRLYADPTVAYYTALLQNISSQYLIPGSVPACDAELQLNKTCHLDLGNWTQFATLPAILDTFRASVTRVDPHAQLCFQDVDIVESLKGVGKAELLIKSFSLVPMPGGGDCTHDDALAWLAWLGDAQHAAVAGFFSVDFTFRSQSCNML